MRTDLTANGSRLKIERTGFVAILTLNRPDVHNAFDELLIAELTDRIKELGGDAAVRAVVLTGAGQSFCAGADLEWMKRMAGFSRDENIADAMALHRMLAAVYECPKVTIARVNGSAIGGGAGLVAACDIAIAEEGANFGFTEVRLG